MAEDANGNCANLVLDINVGECDEGPKAENDLYYVEGDPIVFNPMLNDLGNGNLEICEILVDPEFGTIELSANEITYTPDVGFTGIDSFTYQVCDEDGQTSFAMVYISVTEPFDCGMETIETCTKPFEAITLCVDFCGPDKDLESVEANFLCNINILNPSCFTYLPFPQNTGYDTLQIVGCNYFGNCETITAIVNVDDQCNLGGQSNDRLNNAPLEDISRLEECEINVPNVFSPNGDGVNDVLKIPNLATCYDRFDVHFMVFNRLGQTVYETRETNYEGLLWDGQWAGNADVYFYTLTITDGSTQESKTGFIELRR